MMKRTLVAIDQSPRAPILKRAASIVKATGAELHDRASPGITGRCLPHAADRPPVAYDQLDSRLRVALGRLVVLPGNLPPNRMVADSGATAT
jgi:hypothetical protein